MNETYRILIISEIQGYMIMSLKEKIQETIGIVEDEIKAFETEISLRENEDIPKNFDSNYSKTCYAIQSLERLIEIMKEYQ